MNSRLLAAMLGVIASSSLATTAFADDTAPPQGLLKTTQASSGATDAATSGFEAAVKPKDDKDAIEAKVSAGGLGAAGNSRSLAGTAAANYRIRRDSEQFVAVVAGNYGQSGKVGTGVVETVENVQGKLRYDHFFVGSFAGFLGVSARRDRFQGLNLRLNIDPGVAYYFIDEEKQQLWGELGYDFQVDVRRQQYIDDALPTGILLKKTVAQSGGRAFVGYSNAVSKEVSFNTDVEYIQGLKSSDRFRINWDAGISATVGGNFSIATTLLLQYDNAPLPTVENTDFTMSVSLVYKFF